MAGAAVMVVMVMKLGAQLWAMELVGQQIDQEMMTKMEGAVVAAIAAAVGELGGDALGCYSGARTNE